MTLQRLVDDNPTQEGTKRVVAFITLKSGWLLFIKFEITISNNYKINGGLLTGLCAPGSSAGIYWYTRDHMWMIIQRLQRAYSVRSFEQVVHVTHNSIPSLSNLNKAAWALGMSSKKGAGKKVGIYCKFGNKMWNRFTFQRNQIKNKNE